MPTFANGKALWPQTVHGRWMEPDFVPDLVSVIIPVHNREELILEALDSVKTQTYRPIELIVVDDGSSDNTVEVLETWKAENESPNLTVHVIEQENQGAPVARNRGLIESKGEYIQFLDSDDLLHPQKIEIHANALKESESCRYVWSEFDRFYNERRPDWKKYASEDIASSIRAQQIAVFNLPHTGWAGLYERGLCYQIGPWNESLQRWQDLEYNVRASHQGGIAKKIPLALYGWRHHNKERIENMGKKEEGVRQALHTLSEVEQYLERSGAAIEEPIKRPYMRLADEMIYHDCLDSADVVVDGLIKQGVHTALIYRLRALLLIASAFKGKLALNLKTIYSKITTFFY